MNIRTFCKFKRTYPLFAIIILLIVSCAKNSNELDRVHNVCLKMKDKMIEDGWIFGHQRLIQVDDISVGSKNEKFNPLIERYGSGKDFLCYFENEESLRANIYIRKIESSNDSTVGEYIVSDYFAVQVESYEFPRNREDKRVWCLKGC